MRSGLRGLSHVAQEAALTPRLGPPEPFPALAESESSRGSDVQAVQLHRAAGADRSGRRHIQRLGAPRENKERESDDDILAGAIEIVAPPHEEPREHEGEPKQDELVEEPQQPGDDEDKGDDRSLDEPDLEAWFRPMADEVLSEDEEGDDSSDLQQQVDPGPTETPVQRRSVIAVQRKTDPKTSNTDHELALLKKSEEVSNKELETYRTALKKYEGKLGPPSKDLEEALNRFYRIKVDGFTISASYYTNRNDKWFKPRTKPSRRRHGKAALKGTNGKKDLSPTYRKLRVGKPYGDNVAAALKRIYAYFGKNKRGPLDVASRLRGQDKKAFLKKLGALLKKGDVDRNNAMRLMAYLQIAGLGMDCVNLVSNVLVKKLGLSKGDVKNGVVEFAKLYTNPIVGTSSAPLKGPKRLKRAGTKTVLDPKTKKKKKAKVPGTLPRTGKEMTRPCNGDGTPLVKPGDVMVWKNAGHIAIITRVAAIKEGTDKAVLLEFAHSSPGQKTYVLGRKDPLGERPEGVRTDLIVWIHSPSQSGPGRWKVIRSAYTEAYFNAGNIVGFYRPRSKQPPK